MLLVHSPETQNNLLRQKMNHDYLADETHIVEELLQAATLSPEANNRIAHMAETLVAKVRDTRLNKGGLDAFLYQYDLSSEEGIALMCLAEALLRIPDKHTVDKLIRDKISEANWEEHLGRSDSLFVNATTWGLMLTGKILSPAETSSNSLTKTLKRLIARGGEPLIRTTAEQAMKVLGKQFVMGRNIEEALKRAENLESQGYLFSYDMLGEAARTMDDADKYFRAYEDAIRAVGKATQDKSVFNGSGISVKLSALHPRYEFAQYESVVPYLIERLLELARKAKAANISLTVDAEEADRLDMSLDIIAAVFKHPDLVGWEGLGLAIQSYQKRAYTLIDWLAELAQSVGRRLMIRLIKGAYWDAEIKNAEVKGLSGYPVFTRKMATDVSFLACAKKILGYDARIFYPAFATHNAHSLAAVLEMAGSRRDFEFQCLHGMGYTLYDEVVGAQNFNVPCRVYAPVGGHEDLLAYLVRRLLENGANTSFVNRIINENIAIAEITANPVNKLKAMSHKPHPHIPLPKDLYGAGRKNALGMNLSNYAELKILIEKLEDCRAQENNSCATVSAHDMPGRPLYSPIDNSLQIGTLHEALEPEVTETLNNAHHSFDAWDRTPVTTRAECLRRAADLLEERMAQFMYLAIIEAGKTLADALAEVREAVDFCRYYAEQACLHLAQPETMPGPTGETNQIYLRGRGPVVCISPWNFPLAIFMGQIAAALATGNTVIAKPAMQTTLIGMAAVKLLHEAGIPKNVVQFLPASGKLIGAKIIADPRIKGVIFTGSTETAQHINQQLANRPGALTPFIAETGGQNAMIVDSSALPEQVVADVIQSAFISAGQRCSALRILFLQEDIADKTIAMLCGAMRALSLGDPRKISTDIGPVIDKPSQETLEAHVEKLKASPHAKLLYEMPLNATDATHAKGNYFAPCVFEIKNMAELTREVFGPVLHIIRYKSSEMDKIVAAINSTGYGLTMGIHSRIDETIRYVCEHIKAGNIYVNRNMTGAVVGVQPFGGEGLSGTGPKAGGPHYLLRLCTERTVCINTTASGGNATLMSLSDNAV